MKRKADSIDAECGALPSAKQQSLQSRPMLSLEDLSEELLLQCLSHLAPRDILAVSGLSKHFNRLASDDQLWKRLFVRQFARGRRRRGPSSLESSPFFKQPDRRRTWKELFKVSHNWTTGNARTTQLSLRSSFLPEVPHSLLDVAATGPSDEDDQDMLTPSDESASAHLDGSSESFSLEPRLVRSAPANAPKETHVAWYGRYYFVGRRAARRGQLSPVVSVYTSCEDFEQEPYAQIASEALRDARELGIAELRMDAAPYSEQDGTRLAVFYSSGQYSIFRLRNLHHTAQEPFSASEEYFSSTIPSRVTVMARLHSPLLVTAADDCSVRFRLLHDIPAAETQGSAVGPTRVTVTHSQPTMRSHMCFAPMVIRLEAMAGVHSSDAVTQSKSGSRESSTPGRFRVSLAYSTPYYPSAFTVGIHVFEVQLPPNVQGFMHRPRLSVLSRSAVAVPPRAHYLSTSSASTNDSTASERSPSQAVVTSIEHDGRFVVTSRSDNTISVYELDDPRSRAARSISASWQPQSPSSPSRLLEIAPLRLHHVRTLYGHTASVDAVSVMDGRCVSTGKDGVKLWDLPSAHQHCDSIDLDTVHSELELEDEEEEPVWQTNVQARRGGSSTPNHGEKCTYLALDASKIVTVCTDRQRQEESIRVYDFE